MAYLSYPDFFPSTRIHSHRGANKPSYHHRSTPASPSQREMSLHCNNLITAQDVPTLPPRYCAGCRRRMLLASETRPGLPTHSSFELRCNFLCARCIAALGCGAEDLIGIVVLVSHIAVVFLGENRNCWSKLLLLN